MKRLSIHNYLENLRYGLIAFTLLIPFMDHSRMSIVINKILPARIALLSLLGFGSIVVFYYLLKRKATLKSILQDLWDDNILKALGALWVIRVVSIIQTHNFKASLELLLFFTAMMGMYILLRHVILHSRFFVIKLLKTYVYFGVLIGIYGLAQYLLFKSLGIVLPGVLVGGDYIRLPGTFFDANHFAAYLGTVAPMVIVFAWLTKNNWMRISWWLCYFLIAFVILYSFSRSSLIGFGLSSLIMLLFGIFKGYYRRILPLLAAIAMAGLVIFVSHASGRSLIDRVYSIFNLEEPSTKAHYLLLRGEAELFLENPIFGVGYGGFSEKFRQTETGQEHAEVDKANVRLPAHSVWFEVLTETGLIGFVAYVSFVFIVIRSLVRTIRQSKNKTIKIYTLGFLSGVVGVWTSGIFYSYNLEFFWFFIFLGYLFTLIVNRLIKEKVILPDGDHRESVDIVEILSVLLVTGLSSYFIFTGLGSHILVSSEAVVATLARHQIRGEEFLIPTYFGEPMFVRPPLFYWLSTNLIKLYELSPTLIVRFFPALAGVVSILITYLFARRYIHRTAGVLTSLALLTLTPFVYLTRTVNTEILAFTAVFGSLYLVTLIKNHLVFTFLAGVLLGLAGLLDGVLTVWLLPLFIILLVKFRHQEKITFKSINLILGLFLVIFLPWHVYAYNFEPAKFLTEYFNHVPNLLVLLPMAVLAISYYLFKWSRFSVLKNLKLSVTLVTILVVGLLIFRHIPFVEERITSPNDNRDLAEILTSQEYISRRGSTPLYISDVSQAVSRYYSDFQLRTVDREKIEKVLASDKAVMVVTSTSRAEILLKKARLDEKGLRPLKQAGMLVLLINY